MSGDEYSITVRRPTGHAWLWMFAFTLSLFTVAFAMVFALAYAATSTSIVVGSIESLVALVALGGFIHYLRHRDEAAGEIPFDLWDAPGRRLWPAALVRFYGVALLPLALIVGLVGGVTLSSGVAEAATTAQATIADGPRKDQTVATWRVHTTSSKGVNDGELIRWEQGDHLAAAWGDTVVLSGAWGGVETLTIESIEKKTYTVVDETPLVPGTPAEREETCLVLRGTQQTTDGKHHALSYFFTRDPAAVRINFGAPASDPHSPSPYMWESDDDLPSSDQCPASTASQAGYRDVTVDPRASLTDGKFLVKFYESWTWGAADDPLYLGVATANGTVVYWDATGKV